MYAGLMRSIQKESVRNLWDSTWLQSASGKYTTSNQKTRELKYNYSISRNFSGKQAIYNGLAQYHQSRVCNADKTVGEEIARLQYATRLFTGIIVYIFHHCFLTNLIIIIFYIYTYYI